jgi:hypothetical protein
MNNGEPGSKNNLPGVFINYHCLIKIIYYNSGHASKKLEGFLNFLSRMPDHFIGKQEIVKLLVFCLQGYPYWFLPTNSDPGL